jgi:hypothetical protein
MEAVIREPSMWSSLSTVFGWTDRTSGSRRSRGNRLLAMRAVNRDEVDRRVDQGPTRVTPRPDSHGLPLARADAGTVGHHNS